MGGITARLSEEEVMTGVRKNRAIIIVGIIAIWMLSMGCWIADLWNDSSMDDFYEPAPPETYHYDIEETVVVLEGEATTEGVEVEATAEGIAAEEIVEGEEVILFDNFNILAVQNGATSPTFDVPSATTITKIQTYHWNNASGSGSTGTISLQADDGTVYGPWVTVGAEGQGGVPNAYWTASPNVTIPAGRYTVIDSDPGTWSQNADSGGVGFVIVSGQVTP